VEEVAEAQRGGGQAGAGLEVEQPVEELGADRRLVAEDDHRPVDPAVQRGEAGADRRAQALEVGRVVDNAGAAEIDAFPDLLRRPAEDDHDLVQRGGVGGGDDPLQERPAVERQELFGTAHPAGGAGGQDQSGGAQAWAGARNAVRQPGPQK